MLTFTVFTTAPSLWMARIHNRMPVILQDDQIKQWLDPAASDPLQLAELLKTPPEDFLDCYPVSKEMSSGRVGDPAFADRIEADYASLLKSWRVLFRVNLNLFLALVILILEPCGVRQWPALRAPCEYQSRLLY
jgi:SOS response associated peptidase (SRAP)